MRLMHKLAAVTAGLGAVLLSAGPAAAVVTFDPATGTGFVGKGDVQLAFGWNNAALQKNAGGVSFSSASVDTYAATCTWVTGAGTRGQKTHTVTQTRTASVESAINYDARVKTQITGFNLTGFGAITTTGTVPVVGDVCLGEGTNGTWTAVDQTGSASHLSVTYGGTSVQLL
jgi:hypothetical protein